MYKVVRYFTDLQDNGHPYKVGDAFPRNGLTVSKERLAELSGYNNKQRTPLIVLDEVATSNTMNEPKKVVKDERSSDSFNVESKPRNKKQHK